MRMSKEEKKAAKEKSDKARAESIRIVREGKCPTCGRRLKRNLALTGWWQCEQFGAEGFRADRSKPSCSFQTFTQ